jgi:hypothetical protein
MLISSHFFTKKYSSNLATGGILFYKIKMAQNIVISEIFRGMGTLFICEVNHIL